MDPTLLRDIAHDAKLHLMYRTASFSEPTWYMLRHLNVRIVKRKLTSEDLTGVDFAKVDVDGGEECLLNLEEPKCELVLEIHSDDLLRKFMSKWPRLQLLTETPVQSVYLTRLPKSEA